MADEAPFREHTDVVRPEWVDYNGHMNIAYYALNFENATRCFFRRLDISQAYRERTNHAFFALESHTIFERDVVEGDPLAFTTQLLGVTARRLVCFHAMLHAERGFRAAVNEVVLAHVDLAMRRSVPMPEDVAARIGRVHELHARLPAPPEAGRGIALERSRLR
jgi:acyl-CoA thioester hydrolase